MCQGNSGSRHCIPLSQEMERRYNLKSVFPFRESGASAVVGPSLYLWLSSSLLALTVGSLWLRNTLGDSDTITQQVGSVEMYIRF